MLDVLTLEGERIREVTGFIMPELFARFGLPDELPPTDEEAPQPRSLTP